MAEVTIDFFSDLHCPYAYTAAFRLRHIEDDYAGRLRVRRASLPLEFKNGRPTPKPILDVEGPILLSRQPDIPYTPWQGRDSQWPVTMWPGFEAVHCAASQGHRYACKLDWAIREAFFADSRCISMRHVLLHLASHIGLDMKQFCLDFDGGRYKMQVVDDAEMGWEELRIPASPTFVLPSGRQVTNPALEHVELDPNQNFRPVEITPSAEEGQGWRESYTRMFEEALGK